MRGNKPHKIESEMKKVMPVQSCHFVTVGILMAVIAVLFLFYMGNSLCQTTHQMYDESSSIYANK